MSAPERRRYRVAIVGGGIIGLFTAQHLAERGVRDVVVLDRGFLSSGASGRNGGGVRQQWETPATIRLARESVAAYRRFGREFGYNIWFRQGGYLFLADSESELARLRRVRDVVSGEGLPARVVDPTEIHRRIPSLDLTHVVGGTFLRTDGTLYPFPALWGLCDALRAAGVELLTATPVTAIAPGEGGGFRLATSAGRIDADQVLNAAGGWSADVSRLAGLESPNVATRHEILATEALKPFLDPMVVRTSDGLYFSQTMRGEIVGGLTLAHPTGTARGMPSSIAFLGTMARALAGLVPALRSVGVLRAWSGFYDDTPDGLPVLGEDPRRSGFFHANGFGGHGFMLAPSTTRRVAQAILGERTDLDPAQFGPGRFLIPGASTRPERLNLG